MSIYKKLAWVVGVLLVLFLAYYAFSIYLVSKLDGTGGVHVPAQTLLQYSSEDGVAFMYPDTYVLSSRTEGTPERMWDTLVLIDKTLAANIPEAGGGPPSITMSVFANPEHSSVEQWVKGDSRSNYKLSPDGALTKGTVGGEEAYFYSFNGLYQNDAVAVAHKGKIFLFDAGWNEQIDTMRSDFQNLVSSVQFQ